MFRRWWVSSDGDLSPAVVKCYRLSDCLRLALAAIVKISNQPPESGRVRLSTPKHHSPAERITEELYPSFNNQTFIGVLEAPRHSQSTTSRRFRRGGLVGLVRARDDGHVHCVECCAARPSP